MNTKTVIKPDNTNHVTLPVNASGKITMVASGNFRIRKDDYVLSEDFLYTMSQNEKKQYICFYLMRSKSDGSPVVMVDEMLEGEFPLNMTKDPNYDLLWHLATLTIPENAKDTATALLSVIHSDASAYPGQVEGPSLYPKRMRIS
jgi:hypothetical protein